MSVAEAVTYAVVALFAGTSLMVWRGVGSLYRLVQADEAIGHRERRLVVLRYARAMGWWLVSIGALIMLVPGGMVASGIGPLGMGLLFLLGVRLSRRYRVGPWFAPNL